MDLCVVDEYDVDACGWAGAETVSKERFEEDLVDRRALGDRNTSEAVGGNEEGEVTPADGGLLEDEE